LFPKTNGVPQRTKRNEQTGPRGGIRKKTSRHSYGGRTITSVVLLQNREKKGNGVSSMFPIRKKLPPRTAEEYVQRKTSPFFQNGVE